MIFYVNATRYQIFMETVSQSTCTSVLKSDPATTLQLPSTTVTLPDMEAEHLSLKTVPVNNTQQGASSKHIFSSFRNTFDIQFNPNVFCTGVLLAFWTCSAFTLQLFDCKHVQTILEICVWLYIYIYEHLHIFFVLLSGIRFPKESAEVIQKQKQQLKDAAIFLISSQIPAFVSCFF